MKEKIKKFYEEHKTEAILVSLMVLASTAGVAYHKHAIDGMDVPGINEYETKDGRILVATRKNGSVMTFRPNPNK